MRFRVPRQDSPAPPEEFTNQWAERDMAIFSTKWQNETLQTRQKTLQTLFVSVLKAMYILTGYSVRAENTELEVTKWGLWDVTGSLYGSGHHFTDQVTILLMHLDVRHNLNDWDIIILSWLAIHLGLLSSPKSMLKFVSNLCHLIYKAS